MVLPYINMNRPQVYMCSPHPELSSHLPPHSIPLGCPRALALGAFHASNLHWSCIFFVHVSVIFSQIILPLPSPTEFKSLFFTSMSPWHPACRIINTVLLNSIHMHSVQLLSHIWPLETPWTAARQTSLSITNFQRSFNTCINIQYFSFSLISLYIIGSRFTYLIRTDSNAFIFIAEWYSIL